MTELTAERLREVLSYDPETGRFIWRVRKGNRVKVGMRAGVVNSRGYRLIRIDWRGYLASRLAWLYVHGGWPAATIDHINRQPDDDRIANLREATPHEQMGNQGRRATNTSGFRGICWHKQTGLWRARIHTNGRESSLGYFRTKEAAVAAYDAAAREYFGEFYKKPNGNLSELG